MSHSAQKMQSPFNDYCKIKGKRVANLKVGWENVVADEDVTVSLLARLGIHPLQILVHGQMRRLGTNGGRVVEFVIPIDLEQGKSEHLRTTIETVLSKRAPGDP